MGTYREITEALTAPEALFEMVDVPAPRGGAPVRVFRNAAGSLYDLLAGFEREHADEVLVVDDTGSRTYGEIFAAARRLGRVLSDRHGVGVGDHVGIMMANSGDYLVALFAAARIGAVAVLLNSRASAAEATAATEDVGCGVIVADPRRVTLLREIDCPAALIATAPIPEHPDVPVVADLVAGCDTDAEQADVAGDQPCLILFTSGTSGRAKAVVHSHRAITTVVMNMRYVVEVNLEFASRTYGMPVADLKSFMPRVSSLLIFPLFHVSGIAALMATMNTGGKAVTMRRWDPAVAVDLIERESLSMMAGPPMVVSDLLGVAGAADRLQSLVNVAAGGQATPPHVSRSLSSSLPNARRSAGWGMTEVGGSVCTAGGDILGAFPETSGPMSPTMDVRVCIDDEVVGPDVVGELEVRGGQVMLGYLGDAPGTEVGFDEGWLRTGDIGYVDEFGLIYIVDRKKDLVISAGENISCTEVESALSMSGRIAEVAAFGIPDDRLGERLVVSVVAAEGEALHAEAVRDIARERLPEYKVPRDVHFADAPMPRTATGKLLKRQIRTAYLNLAV